MQGQRYAQLHASENSPAIDQAVLTCPILAHVLIGRQRALRTRYVGVSIAPDFFRLVISVSDSPSTSRMSQSLSSPSRGAYRRSKPPWSSRSRYPLRSY